MTTNRERRAEIDRVFQASFAASPTIWARAPGCLHLMGAPTEDDQGGVVTLAPNLDTWLAVRPRSDDTVRLLSLNLRALTVFHAGLNMRNPRQPWSDLARGVAWRLQEDGLTVAGFDGVLHSTLPLGRGLGSSEAFAGAVATALAALGGWSLDPLRQAALCQEADRQFSGRRPGRAGYATVCVGGKAQALFFTDAEAAPQPVPLPEDLRAVICDTHIRRELLVPGGAQAPRAFPRGVQPPGVRAAGAVMLSSASVPPRAGPPRPARPARFFVEENDRVLRFAEALAAGSAAELRHLCAASFRSARELCGKAAWPIDVMREVCEQAPGAIAVRHTGPVLGGCLVAWVRPKQVKAFGEAVRRAYAAATRVTPAIHPVTAATGAGRLR